MADALSLLNGIGAPPRAPAAPAAAGRDDQTRKAAEKFEAVFLSQMLDSVFAGVNPDSIYGGGSSQKIFRSMMNEQIANHMAHAGGVGIADAVQKELIKLQEALGPGGRA